MKRVPLVFTKPVAAGGGDVVVGVVEVVVRVVVVVVRVVVLVLAPGTHCEYHSLLYVQALPAAQTDNN